MEITKEEPLIKDGLKILWLHHNVQYDNSLVMEDLRNALALSKHVKYIKQISAIIPIESNQSDFYRNTYDIPVLVKKHNADVVIIGPHIADYSSWKSLNKVNIPKFMFCADPATTIAQQAYFAKKNGVTAGLSFFKDWNSRIIKLLGIPVFWMPFCIDLRHTETLVKNKNESNDVLWSPCDSEFYPIRFDMASKKLFPKTNVSDFTIGHHGAKRLSYNNYFKLIINSKMFVFDGTVWNYAVPKYFECLASKTLAMAPKPEDGDDLHFIPNVNFVDINLDNYTEKIEYYLTHKNERETIAANGYKTIVKYHSSKTRAEELIKIIEEFS